MLTSSQFYIFIPEGEIEVGTERYVLFISYAALFDIF